MNTASHVNRPAGFTLVELLVVISIIGILAAIFVSTLAGAIRRAREGAIAMELKQLEMAMERYRQKSGLSYPPDFTVGVGVSEAENSLLGPAVQGQGNLTTRITGHVRNISNRYLAADASAFLLGIDLNSDLSDGVQPTITPDEALVFWLRRTRTSVQFPLTGDGVYDDPTVVPFDAIREDARIFFEFNDARLVDFDGDGYMSYVPPYGARAPYVYFHHSTYLTAGLNSQDVNPFDGATGPAIPEADGVALSYALAARPSDPMDVVDFYAQDQFQIICAGYDGNYGPFGDYSDVDAATGVITINAGNIKVVPSESFPAGANFSAQERDNFATFAEDRLDKHLEN